MSENHKATITLSGVICKQIFVKGQVQGVGFRNAVFQQAKKIGGLMGWVRNLANGDVEILVQGNPKAVNELIVWCHEGCHSVARVDLVDERQVQLEPDLRSFAIRRY